MTLFQTYANLEATVRQPDLPKPALKQAGASAALKAENALYGGPDGRLSLGPTSEVFRVGYRYASMFVLAQGCRHCKGLSGTCTSMLGELSESMS